jgi:hypothetical protein
MAQRCTGIAPKAWRGLPPGKRAAYPRGMPRPPRPQIAGGFYHVTAKGNRGQVIFEDRHDRNLFFVRIRESVELYGWRFHSWCQMTNH